MFWGDVWRQFCPDTAPLLLEQYCCSHFLGTDDGASLFRALGLVHWCRPFASFNPFWPLARCVLHSFDSQTMCSLRSGFKASLYTGYLPKQCVLWARALGNS